MPEPPDFDQLARRIFVERTVNVEMIADSLRQIWNARGAVDLECLALASYVGNGLTALEVQGLGNDIRREDR